MQIAEDVEAFARQNGSTLRLAGHSLGGRMAMAGRHRTGVEAVVFNSSPLSLSERTDAQVGQLQPNMRLTSFRSPQDILQMFKLEVQDSLVDNLADVSFSSITAIYEDDLFRTAQTTPQRTVGNGIPEGVAQSHSIQRLALAMREVQIVIEDGSLAAYLQQPTCRMPVGSRYDCDEAFSILATLTGMRHIQTIPPIPNPASGQRPLRVTRAGDTKKNQMITLCLNEGDSTHVCNCFADEIERSSVADEIYDWMIISWTKGDRAAEAFGDTLGIWKMTKITGVMFKAMAVCGLE